MTPAMNRTTKSKVPRQGSVRVGSFGKAKLQKDFELEVKGLPKFIKYAKRSETCYCLSDGEVTVISSSGTISSIKLKSKGTVSLLSIRGDDKLMVVCVDSTHLEVVDLEKRKSISAFKVEDNVHGLLYSSTGHIHAVTSSQYVRFDTVGQVVDQSEFSSTVDHAFLLSEGCALIRKNGVYSFFNASVSLDTSLGASAIDCAAVSDKLLVTSLGGSLTIYNIADLKRVSILRPHSKTLAFVEVSPDSNLVYTASLDGFLTVTNLVSGKSKHIVDAGSPVLAAARKSDSRFILGLSNGKVASFGKHQKSDTPIVQNASNHHQVLKLLKSFKYRMALLECLKSTSTDQLMSVLTMLNYNGHLKHVVDSLSPSELTSFVRRLCKISIKSRLSPIMIESLRFSVETGKVDIESLKAVRERLSDMEAIQSSFNALTADFISYSH